MRARPLLLAAALLLASPAAAFTFAELSGSGDLVLDVDGDVILDTGGNVFDTITLQAGNSVEVVVGSPPDPSGTPASVLSLSGLSDYSESFVGDLDVEILAWTGALSVSATGTIVVGGGLAVVPGDGSGPCGGGSAIVIGTGASSLPPPSCDDVVLIGGDGPIVVDGPGIVVVGPGVAVPEPSAAVVFGLGLLLVARASRSRSSRA